MPRPHRILVGGCFYHVNTRALDSMPAFLGVPDRMVFERITAEVVERYEWRCHASCQVGNHYHLLVETPEPNLHLGMRDLNGRHARAFNGRHGRRGPLWERRYHAELVRRDSHALELARHIVNNPVRAGLAADAEEWTWSSCLATAGLEAAPAHLTTTWILGQFNPADIDDARRRYRAWVRAGARRGARRHGL